MVCGDGQMGPRWLGFARAFSSTAAPWYCVVVRFMGVISEHSGGCKGTTSVKSVPKSVPSITALLLSGCAWRSWELSVCYLGEGMRLMCGVFGRLPFAGCGLRVLRVGSATEGVMLTYLLCSTPCRLRMAALWRISHRLPWRLPEPPEPSRGRSLRSRVGAGAEPERSRSRSRSRAAWQRWQSVLGRKRSPGGARLIASDPAVWSCPVLARVLGAGRHLSASPAPLPPVRRPHRKPTALLPLPHRPTRGREGALWQPNWAGRRRGRGGAAAATEALGSDRKPAAAECGDDADDADDAEMRPGGGGGKLCRRRQGEGGGTDDRRTLPDGVTVCECRDCTCCGET